MQRTSLDVEVRAYIARTGCTRTWLAAQIGLSTNVLKYICSGDHLPNVITGKRIERFFGVEFWAVAEPNT